MYIEYKKELINIKRKDIRNLLERNLTSKQLTSAIVFNLAHEGYLYYSAYDFAIEFESYIVDFLEDDIEAIKDELITAIIEFINKKVEVIK